MSKTTEQVKWQPRNPNGIGGFKDHPELINPGGRPKNIERFDWWLQHFKDMPRSEFLAYKKKHKDMPMAAHGAWARVNRLEEDLAEYKDTADRTEGKPTERIEIEDTTMKVDV